VVFFCVLLAHGFVFAATKAGSVCVIDSETMQLASSKDAHKGVVKCVRSAMQNEFLSCGNDKMLKLWDVRSKKEAVTLLEHSMVLNHIDVQGERVLTCDRNGIVKICNLRMPGVMLGQVSLEFKESTMCKV
jgi:WD40 repeat protein